MTASRTRTIGVLGDHIELISGQHIDAKDYTYLEVGMPYLTGPADFDDGIIKASKFTQSPKSTCKRGDILVTVKGSGTGTIVIADNAYCISRQLMAVRARDLEQSYVYHVLSQRSSLFQSAALGLIPGIGRPDILEVPIFVPTQSAQRKIGEVLNTWDRAIETTKKLIEAKTLRKRGLMQKLLGGEAHFTEFAGSEWRIVRMNKLLKQIQRPIEWAPDKLLSLVSVRRRSGGLFRREVLRGDQYKTKDLHELETGDFLISKRQVSHGALAMVQAGFEGTHVSKEYSIFINRDADTLYMPFFDWLSRTRRMWHRAFVASNGVVLEKLIFVPKDFLRAEIRIPSNVEEQRRIVAVLDACDREIAILTKKLEAFREQKRGLMQRLLTGEIEVKVDKEETS